MSYRQFVVPDDEEVLDVVGIPAEVGQDAVRTLHLEPPNSVDGSVEFTYDATGRSVRCRWFRSGVVLLDLFREGATRMRVSSDKVGAVIEVWFETDGLAGRMEIAVRPRISITDELLLQ